jgi:hypothetical protein
MDIDAIYPNSGFFPDRFYKGITGKTPGRRPL